MRILAAAVLILILMAPAAAADNTFYFTENSFVLAAPIGDGIGLPLDPMGVVAPNEHSVVEWTYLLTIPGEMAPKATTIFIETTGTILVPAGTSAGFAGSPPIVNFCPWTLRFDVDDLGWNYCSTQYQGQVLDAGIHKLDFSWSTGLIPTPGSAGSIMRVYLTTSAESPDGSGTMEVLVGAAANPSLFEVIGTSEPVPVVEPGPEPPVDPSNSTTETESSSSSAAPSSSSSAPPSSSHRGPTPSSSSASSGPRSSSADQQKSTTQRSSPGLETVLLVVALAGLVVAVRRRL